MADGPLNAPPRGGLPPEAALCPHGLSRTSGLCIPCAMAAMAKEIRPPDGPPRPRPTFNHTREDSPLVPCRECADLMSPASLAHAYRSALADLVEWERDPEAAGGWNGALEIAERVLKATAGEHVEVRSAGSPVDLMSIPVLVNGERVLAFDLSTVTGTGEPNDELCHHCAREKREHPEVYSKERTAKSISCYDYKRSGFWRRNPHRAEVERLTARIREMEAAASGPPPLPAGGQVGRAR